MSHRLLRLPRVILSGILVTLSSVSSSELFLESSNAYFQYVLQTSGFLSGFFGRPFDWPSFAQFLGTSVVLDAGGCVWRSGPSLLLGIGARWVLLVPGANAGCRGVFLDLPRPFGAIPGALLVRFISASDVDVGAALGFLWSPLLFTLEKAKTSNIC